jgi:hypothetical protein
MDLICESLEPRQLLAAHASSDYFPINVGDQWRYSGTVNAEPMTAVTTVANGPATGVPTKRMRTVFRLDDNSAQFVDARFYANNATGFRLVKRNLTEPTSVLSQAYQGSGVKYLPPNFEDGNTFSVSRSFSGTSTERGAFTGQFAGDVFVDGVESITTQGGTFEAVKVRIVGTFSENGSEGWTASGTIAESRWLAKGIGTIRVDYADTIEYNDATGHAFRFNMGLTGSNRINDLANAEVTGNSVVINYGDTTPGFEDGTNFGPVDVNGGTKEEVFRIRNTSDTAITLDNGTNGRISIVGVNAEDFTISRQPPRVIQPGAEVGFRVLFNPSARGLRFATVSIATSNNTVRPFTFNIRGNGVFVGTIGVTGLNDVAITSGANAGRPNDGTRFGTVEEAGSSSVQRTFVIRNTGAGVLTLGSPRITIDGDGAGDFTIQTLPRATIARNSTSSFIIKFDPSVIGSRKAVVSIFSNDSVTPVFTFTVAGTGV